ncbi:hypothetical protein ACFX2I_025487 [Malus domestica]|nr:glucomannan 4-beta-mannosyltransferase 2-like [Malus domestica]
MSHWPCLSCSSLRGFIWEWSSFWSSSSGRNQKNAMKPEERYKYEPIQDDLEVGSSNFLVVLIQIPMFNEREVYKVSIGAACGLPWPSDRVVIQVLDDSTDPTINQMVELECQRWASKVIKLIKIHLNLCSINIFLANYGLCVLSFKCLIVYIFS